MYVNNSRGNLFVVVVVTSLFFFIVLCVYWGSKKETNGMFCFNPYTLCTVFLCPFQIGCLEQKNVLKVLLLFLSYFILLLHIVFVMSFGLGHVHKTFIQRCVWRTLFISPLFPNTLFFYSCGCRLQASKRRRGGRKTLSQHKHTQK